MPGAGRACVPNRTEGVLSHVRFQAVSAALLTPGIAASKKVRGCLAWQETEPKDDGGLDSDTRVGYRKTV